MPPTPPAPRQDLRGYTVLYGGSFDPPHMGHQMACLLLLEAMGADSVCLVPTGTHAFGKRLSEGRHRLAMARLLARPFGERCAVSDVEQRLPPPSTTYQTLLALQQERPAVRFAVAVGADLWPELGRWHEAEALWRAAPLALLGRMDSPVPGGAGPQTLQLPNVQSRDIRARCQAGLPIAGLLPASVADYLQAHGLYQSP